MVKNSIVQFETETLKGHMSLEFRNMSSIRQVVLTIEGVKLPITIPYLDSYLCHPCAKFCLKKLISGARHERSEVLYS